MTHPFSVELYNQHMGNCVVVNGLGEEQVILTTDSLLVHGRPVKARQSRNHPTLMRTDFIHQTVNTVDTLRLWTY